MVLGPKKSRVVLKKIIRDFAGFLKECKDIGVTKIPQQQFQFGVTPFDRSLKPWTEEIPIFVGDSAELHPIFNLEE